MSESRRQKCQVYWYFDKSFLNGVWHNVYRCETVTSGSSTIIVPLLFCSCRRFFTAAMSKIWGWKFAPPSLLQYNCTKEVKENNDFGRRFSRKCAIDYVFLAYPRWQGTRCVCSWWLIMGLQYNRMVGNAKSLNFFASRISDITFFVSSV